MTPYKQLFRHKPEEGVIGDCERTAIGCLLDLPPDQVPHFGEKHWKDSDAFYEMEDAWLRDRGLYRVKVVFQQGSSLEDVLANQQWMNRGVYYLLGGTSRTGCNHTVVGCGGEIAWDPSIDDAGIIGPCDDGYFWVIYLIPISLVRGS